MSIALLIPSTSKNRKWNDIYSSYLYKTLININDTLNEEYKYNYYIGVDDDDIFYDEKNINLFKNNFKNIKFIKISNSKNHLTKIWNILAKIAYKDNNDYYYACGDDIIINKKGWIKECINELQLNDYIGVSGIKNINGNLSIITQPFVHKTHIYIFGFFYPEEIINWYCDNWINEIYCKNRYIINNIYTSFNSGNEERYIIENINIQKIVLRDIDIIQKFLINNFNWKYYLLKYNDLNNQNIDSYNYNYAINHWNIYGKYEGRTAVFDISFYLNYYKDLKKNNIITDEDLINHWINYGRHEGRYNIKYNI